MMHIRRTTRFDITRTGAALDAGSVNVFGTLGGVALAGFVIWSLSGHLDRLAELLARL